MACAGGDPIVAVWRFGLGLSAVYTTESGGAGNREWLGWSLYPRFWAQILKGIFRTRASEFAIRAEITGEQGVVAVDAVDTAGRYLDFQELRARIEMPGTPARPGESIEGPMTQTGPGRYETSLALARDPALVDRAAQASLPEVKVSLSDKLGAGITTFAAMGMELAYAGDPAAAGAAEGEALYDRLADMVIGEIDAAMGAG